jgi:nucleoside-diphosphate-sugar epimerase
LAEALEGCRTIFHLAALGSVPRSIDEPERTWVVNATGTLRVLEAARARGVPRVVFAASSSAYGETERLPKVEGMPPSPHSPYAASKIAGEQLMEAWGHTFGLQTVSLRYFNVFGPRQPAASAYAAVVPRFCAAIASGQRPVVYGDGGQTRDFTYVSNAVLATMQAGSAENLPPGVVINVGSGRRMSVSDLAGEIAGAFGRPDLSPHHEPARSGDVRHSLADITRARDLLGYRPIASVEEGLAETVAWVRRPDGAAHRDDSSL